MKASRATVTKQSSSTSVNLQKIMILFTEEMPSATNSDNKYFYLKIACPLKYFLPSCHDG